jgi:hypothetical protein
MIKSPKNCQPERIFLESFTRAIRAFRDSFVTGLAVFSKISRNSQHFHGKSSTLILNVSETTTVNKKF